MNEDLYANQNSSKSRSNFALRSHNKVKHPFFRAISHTTDPVITFPHRKVLEIEKTPTFPMEFILLRIQHVQSFKKNTSLQQFWAIFAEKYIFSDIR